jgi:hypothetical protein
MKVFKLFNKKDKTFILPDLTPGYSISLNGEVLFKEKVQNQDDFIILQFIGSRDRTGKMIFEGDYIKNSEFLGYVKYNTNGYFYLHELHVFNSNYPRVTPGPMWHQLEVVGNIQQDIMSDILEKIKKL